MRCAVRSLRVLLPVLFTLFTLCMCAQESPSPKIIVLRASRMLNVKSGKMESPVVVVVEGERITGAGSGTAVPAGAQVIDLGDATLLPGLIDCHTHLMARSTRPGDPNDYAVSLLTKSQAYRALEGAADARVTLGAGFTSVRDVESEGSGYADVALRDAINRGLVEGPRMVVATRGIAMVGRYFPFGVSPDIQDFPTGAQLVSGVDEARRAACPDLISPMMDHNFQVAFQRGKHQTLSGRAQCILKKVSTTNGSLANNDSLRIEQVYKIGDTKPQIAPHLFEDSFHSSVTRFRLRNDGLQEPGPLMIVQGSLWYAKSGL